MRKTRTAVLTLGFAAVAASVAIGVGVANASTTHPHAAAPAAVTLAAKSGSTDGAPDNAAVWSSNQKKAALLADMRVQKAAGGGGVKALSSAPTGKDGIYTVKVASAPKGMFTVSVNLKTGGATIN